MSWQRLSPRMLLVHPVHELLRQLPLLVGAIVLGSTTGNPLWPLAGLGLIGGLGVIRWFTTAYRISADDVQLRSGLLRRNVLSVPRNRIRSVTTDARLLHRLLGLTVLRLSTGQQRTGERAFELDAVEADRVPALRAMLLPESVELVTDAPSEVELAHWQPSWLRYAPLSLSGVAAITAGFGAIYQTGFGERVSRAGLDTAGRIGIAATVALLVAAVLVLAVGRSLLSYGNLTLSRRADVLALRYGLLRVREHNYDMARLRGGTLRRPLLVRALGGARLDAVMTGVHGAGEASLLLPPCPVGLAESVLTGLVGDADVVTGDVVAHGPAATRRRWSRALVAPVVAGVALAVLGAPVGVWAVWAVFAAGAALLAADRVRALGHRVDADWLVARHGSLVRRRDCIAAAGIVGWTVRQSYFQRRAKVATLVAATAAGVKAYRVIDVPDRSAWAVAAAASAWVADSVWVV